MFMYVESGNFTGIMTARAYSEFRLQLSTGDFHTHVAVPALPAYADHFGYVDIDPDTGEFTDWN
jgi:hypothetical protein